jgi:hypothetical protein
MTSLIHCDVCEAPAIYECQCRRCAREPEAEERYHACSAHAVEVGQKHWKVRERDAVWIVPLRQPTPPSVSPCRAPSLGEKTCVPCVLQDAALENKLLVERIELLQAALSDIEHEAEVRGGPWAATRAFTARNEYKKLRGEQAKRD